MATKRVGICTSLLVCGVFLAIFGWLALLTVHISNNQTKNRGENVGREKRDLGGSQAPTSGGAIYIRWGRTVCPSDAELVYKGFVGGAYYTKEGGGSDYMCLSEEPNYARYTKAKEGNAEIYGTEFPESRLFDTTNSNPNGLTNSDVLCAVCRSPTRSSSVMIPGTTVCPHPDWNKEYWGYLMTGRHAHKAQHNFVCVDNAPDKGTEGGSGFQGGALMFFVEGRCGSLPCQPYEENYELTCVVCTK